MDLRLKFSHNGGGPVCVCVCVLPIALVLLGAAGDSGSSINPAGLKDSSRPVFQVMPILFHVFQKEIQKLINKSNFSLFFFC